MKKIQILGTGCPKCQSLAENAEAAGEKALPKMIDLGAKKCIPSKKMAPILEELKKDYADKFITEFIDVWQPENAEKAKAYKINLIPTQIFFDSNPTS